MEGLPDWTTSEEERLKSFKNWPFKKGPCCPEKMAEAGFYSIANKSEPDLAKCYVCFKELDGWEKDDDPWFEHKKHQAKCPFVLLKKKPSDLNVTDICRLDVERMKKHIDLQSEHKIKILENMRECVVAELDKCTSKMGKENRKQKTTRTTTKRSSRKD